MDYTIQLIEDYLNILDVNYKLVINKKLVMMMKKSLLLMAIIALPFVFISCKDDKDEPQLPDNHEYVDLGLRSGTLWATCNVGADSPEEYGDYFAWGEIVPKDEYGWRNYKWAHWEYDTIGEHFYHVVEETWYKYYEMNWTENGYVKGDGKMELDPEDDAAYVNWGPGWRMPTLEQLQELVEDCDWQWTQMNGVKGCLVTGRNGNSIFLPASGGCASDIYYDGKFAYYWSRSLYSREKLTIEAAGQGEAYILFFNQWNEQEIWYNSRYSGIPVRAVCASRK